MIDDIRKARDALTAFLNMLPSGKVESTPELEGLLAACWDDLDGSTDGGMKPDKLHRIRKAEWQPPVLQFCIERHPGAARGSTRAPIQQWKVNTDSWCASLVKAGSRQLKPMAPRQDVRPLAVEVHDLIVNHREDARLKWTGAHNVSLRIGKIIPAQGFSQTVAGRRKRFKSLLSEMLEPDGWQRVGPNEYKFTPRAI
jgi:hypothetical protein